MALSTTGLGDWIASLILDRFLGKYLEGLEGTRAGTEGIELHNLNLKKGALAELELPLEIKSGVLGKLVVKLPSLDQVTTKPTIVVLEDLCLLAVPSFHKNDTQADLEKRVLQSKLKLLEISDKIATDKEEDTKKKDSAFVEEYVVKIIENLQIFIKDIHIRFEDSISNPTSFALGITLEGASFKSVGKNWQESPAGFEGSRSKVFKEVGLQKFSIYMDTRPPYSVPIPESKNVADFISNMKTLVPSKDHSVPHDFILDPFSADVKLSLDSKEGQFVDPKLFVKIMVSQLKLSLDSAQFHSLLNLLFWTKNFTLRLQYVNVYSQRPKIRHKKMTEARKLQWWKYAFRCVRDRQRYQKNQWSWGFMQKFIRDKERYHSAKTATFPSSKELKDIEDMEKEYSLGQLQYFRKYSRAKSKYSSTQAVSSEVQEMFTGFQNFFKGKTAAQTKVKKIFFFNCLTFL